VAEVGTHDDQRLVATPQGLDDGRHVLGNRVSDREGYELEIFEQQLQEGQVHLEAVLEGVGLVHHLHLGEAKRFLARVPIDRHWAERRLERNGARRRETPKRHPMAGAEEHDPVDPIPDLAQVHVRGGSHGARVHVAGVGYDDRLGWGQRLREPLRCLSEVTRDLAFEFVANPGIEAASHGGLSGEAHMSPCSYAAMVSKRAGLPATPAPSGSSHPPSGLP